jgi:hypothetical protein
MFFCYDARLAESRHKEVAEARHADYGHHDSTSAITAAIYGAAWVHKSAGINAASARSTSARANCSSSRTTRRTRARRMSPSARTAPATTVRAMPLAARALRWRDERMPMRRRSLPSALALGRPFAALEPPPVAPRGACRVHLAWQQQAPPRRQTAEFGRQNYSEHGKHLYAVALVLQTPSGRQGGRLRDSVRPPRGAGSTKR